MSKFKKRILLSSIIFLAVLGVGSICFYQHKQADSGGGSLSDDPRYRYNEDIVNILCLGVDQRGALTDTGIIGKGGQADTMFILSLHKKEKKVNLISISRDSMVPVDRYDASGSYYDQQTMQLCLQYAYGRTHEESCQLMLDKVSELMDGLPLDGYLAANLDIIPAFNDAVGGVTVTLEDDFTLFDPAMKDGETITLRGEQAIYYIWDRNVTKIGNAERMLRQRTYMEGFLSSAKRTFSSDVTLPLQLLEQSKANLRTNLTAVQLSELAVTGLQCNVSNIRILTVPGEVKDGGKYWEFYIDNKDLDQLIKEEFYIRR